MKKLWIVVSVISAVAMVSACGSKKASSGGAGQGAAGVSAGASGVGAGASGVGAGTSGAAGTTAGTSGTAMGCASIMGMGAPASGNSTCNTCLQAKCNTEVSGCYGPNWASGNTSGGSCSDLISCGSMCSSCSDFTCLGGCLPSATMACTDCGTAVKNCQNNMCATECGSSGAGTGGAAGTTAGTSGGAGTTGAAGATGGKTCADLSACCATIADATQKQQCMAIASTNMDNACNSAYGIYSASNCM